MKIAILGSRGIPNAYGGFEQFAEYLSIGLVRLGHEVYVYCSHNHPNQALKYEGVTRILAKDPEDKMGTFGQFVYDLNCIVDSRKRDFDIIYQLGYTSSSIWFWLLPKSPIIVTNMDGLEWKRSKYSKPVQMFLKFAEKLAVKSSNFLISDSVGIKQYLETKYNADSTFIPYGARSKQEIDPEVLKEFNLEFGGFDLVIARMEPENHIEEVIVGKINSQDNVPLILIGNYSNRFGEYLYQKYGSNKIRFIGGIYNIKQLNGIRSSCRVYFHGHSVGGTNPSLLEAMASKALICAHNNEFNKSILIDNALYFSNSDEISALQVPTREQALKVIEANVKLIQELYSWEKIISDYNNYFSSILQSD